MFAPHRERFGAKRKDGARPIRALASIGLNALRDLRVRALGYARERRWDVGVGGIKATHGKWLSLRERIH